MPPRNSAPAASSLQSGVRAAVAHTPASADTIGNIKIVLIFLSVFTLGNIALTLFIARPKEVVETPAETKANDAMQEVKQLRDDLMRARTSLATSTSEIGRLKTEYAAVMARLASVTTPSTPAHSSVVAPPAAEAVTVHTEGGQK
ncbi:MAG TPA: hypothetical protein VKX17_16440 [Planctomycetota bacterium]|nr:hypothetical protein [Planctomycetota bacterium]